MYEKTETSWNREQLIKWIDTRPHHDTKWANYCMRWWLDELGGLASVW